MTGADFEAGLRAALDSKTKPPGSLGRIEELAAQVARTQGTLTPRASTCHHIIFAADHGIAVEPVSAFPQAVTRQMVLNFVDGGAAANVFCRTTGAAMQIVDAGVIGGPFGIGEVLDRRLGDGTGNALIEPAMPRDVAEKALDIGRDLGRNSSADALSLGEMGIGNTSAATLLYSKLLVLDVAELTGAGTGLDADGLAAKRAILERAAARTSPRLQPIDALSQYGGFEIAMMAGAMIGAVETGKIVLVDGYIATASSVVASQLMPRIAPGLVYSHLSSEQGHQRVCEVMGVRPLLALDLRLGEGTGALLCWPLVTAAVAMLNDMATFESAGVSDG